MSDRETLEQAVFALCRTVTGGREHLDVIQCLANIGAECIHRGNRASKQANELEERLEAAGQELDSYMKATDNLAHKLSAAEAENERLRAEVKTVQQARAELGEAQKRLFEENERLRATVTRWESEDIKQAACCNENEAHIEAALAYIREIEESGSIRIEIERVVRALKGKGEGKKR